MSRTIIGIVKVEHIREKFILGAVTMGVGFFGLLVSLYYWYQGVNVVYLLGPTARYVAGIGGMISLVIGTNLLSEALVLKKMSRGGYELRTKMAEIERRLASRKTSSEAVTVRPESKVPISLYATAKASLDHNRH